jgi:hypothetical protein
MVKVVSSPFRWSTLMVISLPPCCVSGLFVCQMTSAAAASTSTMMRAMTPLLFFFCILLSPSLAEKCRL